MVTIGAAFWLAAALVVAFPAHLAHAEFGKLISDFVSSPSHPLSVLFLLTIDIMIAILVLNDSKVRGCVDVDRN
jgi:hypothetical protein